ncbi:MAG: type II toxin-antitoxin system Phd/YefM family antitoxin [Sporichthyaceae bacterium]
MSTQVNIYEAKTHLSDLVERAAGGEDIVIAKAGTPKVRLVAVQEPRRPRSPGGWQGRVVIGADFDADDDQIAAMFRGEGA